MCTLFGLNIFKNVKNTVMDFVVKNIDLLITLSIYILLTTIYKAWCISTLATLLGLIVVVSFIGKFLRKFENRSRTILTLNFIKSGKGLSSKTIATLAYVLKILVIVFIMVLGYAIAFAKPYYLIALVVIGSSILFTYHLPQIYIAFASSQRKIDAEVELPYVLIFLRAITPLRLPIYEFLREIEDSVALKSFAKEIKLARKVSSVTSTSFLTSLDMVAANHPSDKIRDLFRRVIGAAISMGDIRDVTERVFEEVYTWFESKVSGLVEKFTIIVGTALFAYFFAPILIASITPVIGGVTLFLVIIILSVQVFAFFMLYALVSSYYPSSLVVKPPKTLFFVGEAALIISIAIPITNIFMAITMNYLSNTTLIFILLAILAIPTILSEKEILKSRFYDRFVKMASDALSLSAATGENPAILLAEYSKRFGRRMIRFVRSIVSSYTSTTLRKALVLRAPSIYHASFIETLTTLLRLGYIPESLKAFAASYERLNIAVSRVRAFANTLEGVMIGLSALVGAFLVYLANVYSYMANLIKGVEMPKTIAVITFDPRVYTVIESLSILSLILTSVFVGKVRGGSVLYSFRTAILMLIVFLLARFIASIIKPF